MSENVYKNIDINEIIFTGKNKEYGAYVLRKNYPKFVTISVWCAIIFFFLATAGPMIYNSIMPKKEAAKRRVVQLDYTQLSEPPSIDKKQPVEQVEAPPPLKSTIKFVPPVVKPDEQVKEEYVPTIEELKKVDPGAKTEEGREGGVDYSLIETQDKVVEEPKKEVKAEVFSYVEEMPTFPGGEDALLSYISQKISYPEIAKRAGVEGKIYIQFVVNTEGRISDVIVAKGIGAGCDEEAVRVVRSMPNWKPGRQNGHPVNVRVSIPIVFKLQ